MNQIGAFQADVWNLPMSPRVQNLYELNKLVGGRVKELEGHALDGIYVAFDDDEWDFDSSVILRVGEKLLTVLAVSGISTAIGIVPVNADLGVGMGYRAFGPLAVHFGKRIERLYWRADSSRHPLALGIELADGVHVRIGDGGDTTIPTASTPSSKEYPAEFDDIMLSVG